MTSSMSTQSTEQPQPSTTPASEQSLIRVKNVDHRYAEGKVVALQGVSCEVLRGEHVAIIGKSGSGKTTLLNLIGGLDTPTSGEICFADQTLGQQISLDAHRHANVGFVFQSYYLLPNLTASENIQISMFGDDQTVSERKDRARKLLSEVGLADRSEHLPSAMSGGECQRVAIARALANAPPLILADEPTGALDSQTGESVLDLLESLNRNSESTLMVVTHDDAVAERAQRVIRLVDGEIV